MAVYEKLKQVKSMRNGDHHIVGCLNCGTKNRIHPDKIESSPKCGKCGFPLRVDEGRKNRNETFLFRCTECGTRNMIPEDKVNENPKCGKCKSSLQIEELFLTQPIVVSDSNFDSKVLKSPLPVVLFAWAPWCPTCTAVAPVIDDFANDSKGKIRVGKLNVDDNPMLSSRYTIRSVPLLFIFDNGQLKETLPGAIKKHELMMKMAHYV
jgi:thioredoxin 2